MFDVMAKEVRRFEQSLTAHRTRVAKQRRQDHMKYVFADCKDPRPKPIDSLVQRTEVIIEDVVPAENAVVLAQPVTLDASLPMVTGGIPRVIVAHCEDKVWLESVDDIEVGQTLIQEEIASSDAAIMQKLREVWEPRWNKLSHVTASHWDDINSFAAKMLPPIQWSFPAWTGTQVRAQIQMKKPTAGVGPDGVTQTDLAALPSAGCEALADMYKAIENGATWPIQTSTRFVASLAKCEDATGPDQYRPVTVYSLPYRLWSSARSRQALLALERTLPESVQGGCPFRASKNI